MTFQSVLCKHISRITVDYLFRVKVLILHIITSQEIQFLIYLGSTFDTYRDITYAQECDYSFTL